MFSLQDGDTPLMRAVRTRNELCVRFLLDKGAKVGVYDKVSVVSNFILTHLAYRLNAIKCVILNDIVTVLKANGKRAQADVNCY